MKIGLYLPALLAILVLSVATAYAQFDRHTPGFPDTVFYGALYEMGLDPRLFKTLNDVLWSAASGELTDADIANAMRDVLRSGAPLEDVLKALSILSNLYGYSEPGEPIPLEALHDLANSVSSTELREYLKSLLNEYASGTLTPQDIESLLKTVGSLYQAGGADLRDALVATEVSRLLGRSAGYADTVALAERLAEALTKAEPLLGLETAEGLTKILDLLRPSDGGDKPTGLDSVIPDLGSFGNSLPNLLPSVASAGLAAPSIQLPRVDLSLIAYVAVPIAVVLGAVALFKVLNRLPRALSGVLRLRPSVAHLPELRAESLRAAIRNYWTGVKFIESTHGVVRHPWETHREYLSRVAVGREAFEGLTEAYELAKYAQLESREIDERSESYLRKLVGGK
ncbi:MAG: DUF4129 domain-containing protein [Candidatus Nezhaarchaeales archaeon]